MSIGTAIGEGLVYGDRKIVASGSGEFFVVNKDTLHEVSLEDKIDIDGDYTAAVPIQAYGMRLKDFAEVPLNKYGLKEVAKSGFETLVVTANELFVIYSGGLPSLQGMPSDIQAVSGVWADEDGEHYLPKMTVYDRTQYSSLILVAMQTSFRKITPKILGMVHAITTQEMQEEQTLGNYFLCTYSVKNPSPSMYAHLFPGFTKSYADLYDVLVGNSDRNISVPGQLKAMVIAI